MTVTLLLFARAQELAGSARFTLDLPKGSRAGDLKAILAKEIPSIASLMDRCAIGINGEFASPEDLIDENSEIALLPPVSGG